MNRRCSYSTKLDANARVHYLALRASNRQVNFSLPRPFQHCEVKIVGLKSVANRFGNGNRECSVVLFKPVEKFVDGSPVCVMIRGSLEYALSEEFVNELFEKTATPRSGFCRGTCRG